MSEKNQAAGKKGGKAKNPRKGFGSMDKERLREIAKKAAAARWGKR